MPLAERKIEAIATGPEVVERINAILAEKKIPKMQFYRACGITPGAYSQWKAGLTSPALKTLNADFRDRSPALGGYPEGPEADPCGRRRGPGRKK